MNGKSFDILNNIISTKKTTDDFLNKKILESENSFEIFECNFPKDKYEINNNNNIESRLKINKLQNKIEKKENKLILKEKDDYINGGIINKDKIEYKKIIKNKNNQNKSMDNISNGYNKIKKISAQINKGCFQIKNKDNNNLKLYNKRNINKKIVNSNSVDFINVHKNKELYERFALSKKKDQRNNKRNKNKKINIIHNKSVDYNLNKKMLNDNGYLTVNNRFNIYQKLLEIKIENIEKFRLNSKNEKNNYILNNILTSSPIRLFTLGKKYLFSDDEIIKDKNGRKKKNNNKNKSNTNSMNNSNIDIYINPNKLSKEFSEDEVSSLKSKKSSKAQRQNSLSSFMSNNSSEKFFQIYERFKEMQKKQKEKIEILKKVKEDNNSKICYFSPKINQKSRNLKGDFYTRQKNNYEHQKQKYEKIKTELKKRKEAKLLFDHKINIIINNKKPKLNKLNIKPKSRNELYKYKQEDKITKSPKKNLYYKDYNLNSNNYKLSYIEKELEKKKFKNNGLIKKEKQRNINNISSPNTTQKVIFIDNFSNKDEEIYLNKKGKNKKKEDKRSINNIICCINNDLRPPMQKMKKTKNKSTEYFIKNSDKINRKIIENKNNCKNNINNIINRKNIKKYKTNNK